MIKANIVRPSQDVSDVECVTGVVGIKITLLVLRLHCWYRADCEKCKFEKLQLHSLTPSMLIYQ